MTSTEKGRRAEAAAATYLQQQGFKVLETNWRTRLCEIDIVAEKDGVVFFVEVKFRQKELQGHGMDYITQKKLKQMAFAAESWVSYHEWRGEFQLAAIEVSGDDYAIGEFTADIWI